MNIILITGASSGIGKEFALQLDASFANIDEFWLVARNCKKLEDTARVIHHKTRLFPMDITDKYNLLELKAELEEKKPVIRMLINCAGYGLMGSFKNMETEEQAGMIRLNCEAMTSITHICIPFMRKNSRIIQMASSAAFLPQPNFAIYAATKSYVLSFSRALKEELRKEQIYVTAVCPGPVDTEFFDIAEKYENTLTIKKFTMVTAQKVVHDALLASYHKRTMSVCSIPIKAFELFTKVMPHAILVPAINMVKDMEKKPKEKSGGNYV